MSDSPSKRHVLIGEDVHVISFKMAHALEHAGFAVETAGDGEECLRKARLAIPDLLVLDIMMPKLHGIDVLKALRSDPATERIGVLVCTAKDFKTEQDECRRLGVHDFLIKPFEASDLIMKVEAFFNSSRSPASGRDGETAAATTAEPFRPQLETVRGCFSLWGARGSTPTPGASFLRHGGNTSCLSITHNNENFIFDAGSGIRDLGLELMRKTSRKLHLFITHTHWDHIQGFPFFTPAYEPGFEIEIYGAEGFGKDLESIFRGQLDSDYFPVQMDDLNSSICFRHLTHNPVDLGDVKVWWEYVQHPGATVGYKIDLDGFRIAWVPDNEFLQGYLGAPESITRDDPLVAPYRKVIEFLSGVDLLIHEAQYTNDEYPDKVKWGHSSISNACLLVKFAGVRRWIVTHHDPSHDDTFLEMQLNVTRQLLSRIGHACEVTYGYDGLTEYL